MRSRLPPVSYHILPGYTVTDEEDKKKESYNIHVSSVEEGQETVLMTPNNRHEETTANHNHDDTDNVSKILRGLTWNDTYYDENNNNNGHSNNTTNNTNSSSSNNNNNNNRQRQNGILAVFDFDNEKRKRLYKNYWILLYSHYCLFVIIGILYFLFVDRVSMERLVTMMVGSMIVVFIFYRIQMIMETKRKNEQWHLAITPDGIRVDIVNGVFLTPTKKSNHHQQGYNAQHDDYNKCHHDSNNHNNNYNEDYNYCDYEKTDEVEEDDKEENDNGNDDNDDDHHHNHHNKANNPTTTKMASSSSSSSSLSKSTSLSPNTTNTTNSTTTILIRFDGIINIRWKKISPFSFWRKDYAYYYLKDDDYYSYSKVSIQMKQQLCLGFHATHLLYGIKHADALVDLVWKMKMMKKKIKEQQQEEDIIVTSATAAFSNDHHHHHHGGTDATTTTTTTTTLPSPSTLYAVVADRAMSRC